MKTTITTSAILVAILVIAIIAWAVEDSTQADEPEVKVTPIRPAAHFPVTILDWSMIPTRYGPEIHGSMRNNTHRDLGHVSVDFVCYNAAGEHVASPLAIVRNFPGGKEAQFDANVLAPDAAACQVYEITTRD